MDFLANVMEMCNQCVYIFVDFMFMYIGDGDHCGEFEWLGQREIHIIKLELRLCFPSTTKCKVPFSRGPRLVI